MPSPKKSLKIPSSRTDDQPANRKMLTIVRDELRSEIRSLDRKMDARFHTMESRFEDLKADNQRIQFLVEEQNANNRIVLEGLQALWQRQDRIEKRLESRP